MCRVLSRPPLPINSFTNRFCLELTRDCLEPPFRVGNIQARPPRKVLQRGWSMTPEITSSEFRERLVAIYRGRRWDALIKERVGELFTDPWATANNTVQLCSNEDVRQPHGIICRHA